MNTTVSGVDSSSEFGVCGDSGGSEGCDSCGCSFPGAVCAIFAGFVLVSVFDSFESCFLLGDTVADRRRDDPTLAFPGESGGLRILDVVESLLLALERDSFEATVDCALSC